MPGRFLPQRDLDVFTRVNRELIGDLKASGGNVDTIEFLDCLEFLSVYYKSKSWDGRGISKGDPFSLQGSWLTLSKPNFSDCKGCNEKGEFLYSLGRLSFDMFKPTNLICSVQASFNYIHPINPQNTRPLYVPKN